MLKPYTPIIFVLLFIVSLNSAYGQKTGDICSNPLIAKLCDSATITISTDSLNNDVSAWDTLKVVAAGPDVFYQINLPSTPYNTTAVNAVFTGYFRNQVKQNTIYFLWFENSPCSTTPVKIDSFPISSNSFEFPDSFIISYPVINAQSTYYLAVDFKNTINTANNLSYQFTLHFGYNSDEPNNSNCHLNSRPYKGTLLTDPSVCYSHLNPYDLFTSQLHDSTDIPDLFLPSSLQQGGPVFPVNDQLGNGFVLELKRTIIDSTQKQEIYIAYDNFPYYYAQNSDYVVGITVFMKNWYGTSGLKGFRMKIPGATLINGTAIPVQDDFGTYNDADPSSHWNISYDDNANTCTWIYKTKTGRGDNIRSNYSCEAYTFSVRMKNLGDTIKAWYLPDNYGNDSLSCLRTDCHYGDYGATLPGWVELGGGGSLGGGQHGITGSAGCSNNTSTCENGTKLSPCGGFAPSFKCDFTTDATQPFVEYYDDGCFSIIYPITNNASSRVFTDIPNGTTLDTTICSGKRYNLALGIDSGLRATVVFYDTTGVGHPVDVAGVIYDSVDYDSYALNLNALPAYPYSAFRIPVSKPGSYRLKAVTQDGSGQLVFEDCFGTLNLHFYKRDSITATAANDTICRGDHTQLAASGGKNYQWIPANSLDTSLGTSVTASPFVTTIYSAIEENINNCFDTANVVVNVKICPPKIESFGAYDSVCQNQPVGYSLGVKNSPDTWEWSFPGGNPSSFNGEIPPPVYYNTPGNYLVYCVVSNSAGKDSLENGFPVRVKDCSPKADFTMPQSTCPGNCVPLNDKSYNNPTSWKWSFDYQQSFEGQYPPMLCYYDLGQYTVKLVVSNAYGSDSITNFLEVLRCTPQAYFIMADTICYSDSVIYYNQTTQDTADARYQWSFIGGSPSSYNGRNPPPVFYTAPGTYQTQLVAYNYTSYDTLVKPIVVKDCNPKALFSMGDTICFAECMPVINQSSSGTTAWQWSFPGGNPKVFSGKNPPPVCYDTIGSYSAVLIASNHYGTDTFTIPLTVKSCPPKAHFSVHDTICKTQCLSFHNSSTGNANTYQWFFPGGNPPAFSGFTPLSICYDTAGNFAVTLIVYNASGSDTLSLPNVINVSTLPQAVVLINGDTLRGPTGAMEYQWYLNNESIGGATGEYYVAPQHGSYSLFISGHGCTGFISINFKTSVEDVTVEDGLLISPNPNAGVFTVSFKGNIPEGTIEVRNILGEVVDTRHKTQDTRLITIDLSPQANGIYFVRLQTANGIQERKVIINR